MRPYLVDLRQCQPAIPGPARYLVFRCLPGLCAAHKKRRSYSCQADDWYPVLPPTDESTCAEAWLGFIWIKGTPRRYVAAANPVKSPTTPPPRAKTASATLTSIRQESVKYEVQRLPVFSCYHGKDNRKRRNPFCLQLAAQLPYRGAQLWYWI